MKNKRPQTCLNENRALKYRHITRKDKIKIIRVLGAVIIMFGLCSAPHQIAWMLYHFGNKKEKEIGGAIFIFSTTLQTIHASINPFIYGIMSKHSRKEYMKILAALYNCFTCNRYCVERVVIENIPAEDLMYHSSRTWTAKLNGRMTTKGLLTERSLKRSVLSMFLRHMTDIQHNGNHDLIASGEKPWNTGLVFEFELITITRLWYSLPSRLSSPSALAMLQNQSFALETLRFWDEYDYEYEISTKQVHLREPASFWRENLVAVVVLLPVLARMSYKWRKRVIKCKKFYHFAIARRLNLLQYR